MRLATFNVENMFERPAAMNLPTWSDGRKILEDFAALNDLIAKPTYTAATKAKLLTILGSHKGLLTQGVSKFIRLREVRGKLIRKPTGKPREIAVDGRSDWIGWFELVEDQVNKVAILNTARIVGLVNADVQCLIEADDRIAVTRFNDAVLKQTGETSYEHVMLIDGNDDRGIDVGVLTRAPFAIESIVSHVDDADSVGTIFSRDCVEYRVALPAPSFRTSRRSPRPWRQRRTMPPSSSTSRSARARAPREPGQGSAKTNSCPLSPGSSSGVTRRVELATPDGPVATATYCVPSTAKVIG